MESQYTGPKLGQTKRLKGVDRVGDFIMPVPELPDGTLRLGGAHKHFCDTPGTDGYWFQRGYAVLTPLALTWVISEDLTSDVRAMLESAFEALPLQINDPKA